MDDVAHPPHADKLRRVPFFCSLPPDVLAVTSTRLRREHYWQGGVIRVEGSTGDSMTFIESDRLKISSALLICPTIPQAAEHACLAGSKPDAARRPTSGGS